VWLVQLILFTSRLSDVGWIVVRSYNYLHFAPCVTRPQVTAKRRVAAYVRSHQLTVTPDGSLVVASADMQHKVFPVRQGRRREVASVPDNAMRSSITYPGAGRFRWEWYNYSSAVRRELSPPTTGKWSELALRELLR
jgi:hypothetical protein